MIITRFQGEMLHSQAIRAHRLEFGECAMADKFFPRTDGRFGTSLRLPLPKQQWRAIAPERSWTMHDATAWPLWGLVTGSPLSNFGLERRYGHFGRCLIREQHLKFCDDCAREQQRDHGVCWWERNFNLPLIAVCPKHGTPLRAASIDWVLASALPHEVLRHSKPVISHVDEKSINIARNIIVLCDNSPLIDTGIALACAADYQPQVARRATLRRALGASAEYILDAKRPSYQRLFHKDDLDDILAALVVVGAAADDVTAQLRQASIAALPLPEDIIPSALQTITELIQTRCYAGTLATLEQDCKDKLEHRASSAPLAVSDLHNLCLQVLLLFVLDRSWLESWIAENCALLNGFYPLNDWQCRAGMYILAKACEHYRGSVEHRPDVQKLMQRDQIIIEWDESFVAACARQANWFFTAITREYRSGTRHDFASIVAAVEAILQQPAI